MKLADHVAQMQALLVKHPHAEIMKVDYSHGITELEAEVEIGYRLPDGEVVGQFDVDAATRSLENWDALEKDIHDAWDKLTPKLKDAWGTKEKMVHQLSTGLRRAVYIKANLPTAMKVVVL